MKSLSLAAVASLMVIVQQPPPAPAVPIMTVAAGSGAVEQTSHGTRPPAELVAGFDGLGVGFEGPQGTASARNPSDNSLAVGPDHIVQTVNSRMAIFTKKGKKFDTSGKVLYGPVNTNNVFKGFGGQCEAINNGDAVVRYDQLADRWLIVMPTFRRGPERPDQPDVPKAPYTAYVSVPGRAGQPGPAVPLFQPPASAFAAAPLRRGTPGEGASQAQPGRGRGRQPQLKGPYSMCYAISTGPDPFGPFYRYEFLRPLFPDYPRPAVWPDGYYNPTSTGDDVIEKHACVVDRASMLKGKPASEQCVIVPGVNFLNNADIDGKALPPSGAPNIMMAAGGTQLKGMLEDNVLLAWRFHVDWKDPAKTNVAGPSKISVAPYHYLCGGQLTNCVPQPGTERRLDAQGDKIMARLVYRRVVDARQRDRDGAERGDGAPASDRAGVRGGAPIEHESIVAVHSVNTVAGGGGVRWYELRIDKDRNVRVHQQGTYAPDGFYRWMASPAIDRFGNIGIGYSFGGPPNFVGQRFAGRLAADPPGTLMLKETVLVEGEASQTTTVRWEDYTQTAVDPSDDCTIWYVGDYLKKDATTYSTRIGAFRFPGCR